MDIFQRKTFFCLTSSFSIILFRVLSVSVPAFSVYLGLKDKLQLVLNTLLSN